MPVYLLIYQRRISSFAINSQLTVDPSPYSPVPRKLALDTLRVPGGRYEQRAQKQRWSQGRGTLGGSWHSSGERECWRSNEIGLVSRNCTSDEPNGHPAGTSQRGPRFSHHHLRGHPCSIDLERASTIFLANLTLCGRICHEQPGPADRPTRTGQCQQCGTRHGYAACEFRRPSHCLL